MLQSVFHNQHDAFHQIIVTSFCSGRGLFKLLGVMNFYECTNIDEDADDDDDDGDDYCLCYFNL